MTRIKDWAAVVLLALAASSPMAQDGDKQPEANNEDVLPDVQFKGRKIDPDELADSEPRQIIGRDDLASVVSGKGLKCKDGALSAGYSHAGGFIFEDGTVAVDDVIAEVRHRHAEGRLSCFFVESADYDRAVFDRLVAAMGTGSVSWMDPPTRNDLGADDRTQDRN
jgi:hypothetical protein